MTYIESMPETVFRAFVDSDLSPQFWLHKQVSDWKPGSRWEHRRGDGSGVVDIVNGTRVRPTASWPKVLCNLKTLLETGHNPKLDWGGLKKLGRRE